MAGFQKIILPASGRIAPRSLINQYGLTWWFGPVGLQNLDSALNQNISSKLYYQDAAMTVSKQNISYDMSGICSCYYENYLAISVPSGDIYNRHTWVLDQNPFDNYNNVWPSYWTGWRPVEWSRAVIGGQARAFFVSKDYDGNNRVWEAFMPQHNDNGAPITCFVQTKQHNFGDAFRKKWKYSRAFLSDIWNEVALKFFAMPKMGSPFFVMSKDMVATGGQVYDDQFYGGTNPGHDNLFRANRPQENHEVYSKIDLGASVGGCSTCGVEKNSTSNLDYAFGMLIIWSGDMAVDGYQIFVSMDKEKESGKCEPDEVGPLSVNAFGCGGDVDFPDGSFLGDKFTSTAHYCAAGSNLFSADSGSDSGSGSGGECSTYTSESVISQKDADRKASMSARFDADFRSGIYL